MSTAPLLILIDMCQLKNRNVWELDDWFPYFLIRWLDATNEKDVAKRSDKKVRRVYTAPGLFGSGAYFLLSIL